MWGKEAGEMSSWKTMRESDVTDPSWFYSRRSVIKSALALGLSPQALLAAELHRAESLPETKTPPAWLASQLKAALPEANAARASEEVAPFEIVAGYNNFYEFGTDKRDPKAQSGDFNPWPWSIEVEGAVEKRGLHPLESLISDHQIEERIYRLRCVEAWSMVIPWLGIPLRSVIERLKPASDARYIRFESVMRPEEMPGQRSYFGSIDYPYVEGLRMDEAMHPLTFLAVGVYGQALPNQNGAPVRLVVPWKYGFKSIKSIAKMTFTKKQPKTTWELTNAREYGFYANVNPQVSHPRWSQASERRLPGGFFGAKRQPTLMFNGYGDEVASLYQGMNLRKYF
jgi:sulfoxide reductase catalytic subunit YedY